MKYHLSRTPAFRAYNLGGGVRITIFRDRSLAPLVFTPQAGQNVPAPRSKVALFLRMIRSAEQ